MKQGMHLFVPPAVRSWCRMGRLQMQQLWRNERLLLTPLRGTSRLLHYMTREAKYVEGA